MGHQKVSRLYRGVLFFKLSWLQRFHCIFFFDHTPVCVYSTFWSFGRHVHYYTCILHVFVCHVWLTLCCSFYKICQQPIILLKNSKKSQKYILCTTLPCFCDKCSVMIITTVTPKLTHIPYIHYSVQYYNHINTLLMKNVYVNVQGHY